MIQNICHSVHWYLLYTGDDEFPVFKFQLNSYYNNLIPGIFIPGFFLTHLILYYKSTAFFLFFIKSSTRSAVSYLSVPLISSVK